MTRFFVSLSVVVGLPYDVRAVVCECRRLLGTPDAVPPLTSQSVHAHIFNPLDWDVPAGLWVEYGIDGPMRESPAGDATDDQRQAIADDPTRNGWAAMTVKFEPVYWWPDISHTRASDHDLGAWLVSELGRWPDQQKLPWRWEANGATTYIPSSDRHQNLASLGDASRGAITAEDTRRVNDLYLADWRGRWRPPGPDHWASLLPRWKPTTPTRRTRLLGERARPTGGDLGAGPLDGPGRHGRSR